MNKETERQGNQRDNVTRGHFSHSPILPFSPSPQRRAVPFALPSLSEKEMREVVGVLESGWLTTGEKTREFETKFAQYVGAKYAAAVASATAGLFLSLKSLGIKEGDEVLVPTLTFCATANVCVHLGAVPVLCDVGDDFNISLEDIKKKKTHRTKAVIPVHFAGYPCALDSLLEISRENNWKVIEDAAHACGGEYNGKKLGTFSDSTVFSFYPTKNITTGEGGMVTTEKREVYERVKILTQHGISRDAYSRYHVDGGWYYEVIEPGYKFNMTDLQSAIGIAQLERIEEFIARRNYLAARYTEAFRFLEEIKTPPEPATPRHSWHLYIITLELEKLVISRDEFICELARRNIGSSVHYIPLHRHPYYAKRFGYKRGDFPKADSLADRIISLPLYPAMTEEDVDYVIGAILEIVRTFRR